nr:MAG TPA: Transcription initiation factor IIE, alpha FINGER, Transcription [Caudoviricetes sp.]
MDEYLSRHEAIRAVQLSYGNYEATRKAIFELPAADVAPVRHGRWKYNTDFQVWNCSECGENPHKGTGVVVVEENLPAYCPHCGARMNGVE